MAATSTYMVKPSEANSLESMNSIFTNTDYLTYVNSAGSFMPIRIKSTQNMERLFSSSNCHNYSTIEYAGTEGSGVFIRYFLETMSNIQNVRQKRWETNLSTTQLQQTVISRFSTIPEVEAIYYRVRGNEHLIMVFTNMDKYNNDVMQKMIRLEIEIEEAFANYYTEFNYVPTLVDKQDVIENGKYINLYQRS